MARTCLYRLAKLYELTVAGTDPSANWELLVPEKACTLSEIGPFDAKDSPHRFQRGDGCYVAFLGGRLLYIRCRHQLNSLMEHPVIECVCIFTARLCLRNLALGTAKDTDRVWSESSA